MGCILSGIANVAASVNTASEAIWRLSPNQDMSNLFGSADSTGPDNIIQARFNQVFQSDNQPAVFRK